MASSGRVFSQTFRFARSLKRGSLKVQKLGSSLHVTSATRKLSHAQLSRPLASVSGLLNGQMKVSLKTKIQCSPQQGNCSLITRSTGFLSAVVSASEDCSVASSEGSDSSCEAMEGPHGDDDGLVIHDCSTQEDL